MRTILFLILSILIFSTIVAQNPIIEQQLVPFSDGGLFGFKDSLTQKICISPEYNGAGFFLGKYAKVKVNNKWGVINRKGDCIVDMAYDSVMILKNNFFLCYANNKVSILDNIKHTIGICDNFLKIEDGKGVTTKFIDPSITDIFFENKCLYILNNGGLHMNVTRTDTIRVVHTDGMTTKYFVERNKYPYITGGKFYLFYHY